MACPEGGNLATSNLDAMASSKEHHSVWESNKAHENWPGYTMTHGQRLAARPNATVADFPPSRCGHRQDVAGYVLLSADINANQRSSICSWHESNGLAS